MNANRLLAHYERIADAPDVISRMRRFILDLAVRGKLVEQDPEEEPASELLKRIGAEKARLVKAREIKKPKPSLSIDEPPFDLPANWCWALLGEISAYIQRGKSPKYTAADGSPVVSQKCVQWDGLDLTVAKLVTLESLEKYDQIRVLRDGDLLWNSTGTGTIGRVIRLLRPQPKLVCDSHVTVVRCLLADPEYVRTWLRTDYVYGVIEERAAGSTNQVELTAQMANWQPVPLPPLAEQHRIAAKVDELMALCDRLEAARADREATRDRLTAASLVRLNAPDPDPAIFRVHTAFALENIAPLTTRLNQIKALRQTILNLAVRGKLVEQDPEEEPASELLKRIGAEKARLVKAREIKKPKPSLSIDEPPFDLPANWCWALLGEISAYIQRGKSPKYTAADGSPVVSQKCVQWDGLDLTVAKLVTLESLEKYDQIRVLRDGDLLWNSTGTGTIGRVIRLLRPQPKLVCDSHVTVVRCLLADPEYVRTWLRTDYVYGVIEERAAGSTNQVELTAQMANGQPVPLPPLAEQHRIAAKVDELMALCDRLKASLATSDDTRRRTLDALLHDALAPASREMEAAE